MSLLAHVVFLSKWTLFFRFTFSLLQTVIIIKNRRKKKLAFVTFLRFDVLACYLSDCQQHLHDLSFESQLTGLRIGVWRLPKVAMRSSLLDTSDTPFTKFMHLSNCCLGLEVVAHLQFYLQI
jgi:hypothetical protein